MQSALPPDLRGAFELVRDVVTDLEARGRITASAGIKPEMQRRSLGGFEEHRLGFRSFGDFLRAAQRAGVIARVRTADGREVFSAVGQGLHRTQPFQWRGARSLSHPRISSIRPRGSERRLRPDIWAAFVDWKETIRRVYDRERRHAYKFSVDPEPGEPREDAELRAAALANGARFVPIKPIGMEQQREWMLAFIDSHSTHPLAVPLRNTMAHGDRPFQAFSRIVRTDPDLAREWNRTRLNRVAAVVTAWMADHELEFDPWEGDEQERDTRPEPAARESAEPDPELTRVRAALHAAIDRMPEAELLKLSIPLQYLTRTGL
jgi:hypothetical protein